MRNSAGRLLAALIAASLSLAGGSAAQAAQRLPATVGYQPMTDGGLTAGRPFEAWIVFGSSNPAIPGYSLPSGAQIRVTFPAAFTPQSSGMQGVVLLYGWPQNAIDVPFTVARDAADARTIVITLEAPIAVDTAAAQPGLKAIHLRTTERNPAAREYPLTVTFVHAGASDGIDRITADIHPERVANIAQYNQLHGGRDENWQHVRVGQTAHVPVDLLVNRHDAPRATLQLAKRDDGGLNVVADGEPIGTIAARGVPVTLIPHAFGPGFARLGIVEFEVQAGQRPGDAEIEAQLGGGTSTTIHVAVEP